MFSQDNGHPPHYFYKPNGLWVSVDGVDDWADWLVAERCGWRDRYRHKTRLILRPNAPICWLRSPAELDAFTTAFRVEGEATSGWNTWWIDWPRVATCYGGVVATRYLYERRMASGSEWYYGWDVSGGCIWDGDCVDHLEPVKGWALESVYEDQEAR